MRKAQKQEILGLIDSLHQIHEEIKKALEQKNLILAQDMISGAQGSAISLGENIEKVENEGHITVSYIEEYCESLFCVFEDINKYSINVSKVYKMLRKQLIKIENSVKNDITVRQEVVFFPYKASMWDSLESIYLAAKADPDCDAYCVPIPYYTLNPDRSFGEMHYEGNEYPEDIEVTDWEEYNFEERRPDAIYIHNPYDNCNLVTNVHPRFYSFNLKKYTDCLVYVPYYVTSGGMLEAQGILPSYQYVDYIVTQSPQFRKYFDKHIPTEKFLPFGSPKVDRVIKKCQNPPAPPKAWLEKMTDQKGRRKRVIFYNTGISDMLSDTETFLKKMEYVFQCFKGREDVCMLWRPHPLLESTFDSMRPEFRSTYGALKKKFLGSDLGIYDAASDIEDSIALSDAYIGDAGTSVISLFGIAGKPIFILNNQILEELEDWDWRKKICVEFCFFDQNQFAVVQGHKLYMSEPGRYHYKYFCDLPQDNCANHYYIVSGINGEYYACPSNAQYILAIGKTAIEKKIELEKTSDGNEILFFPKKYEKYLLMLSVNYPAVVRYDTVMGEIKYLTENVDGFVKVKNGQKITGGSLIHKGNLYIASPVDNMVYKLDIKSGESSMIELPIQSKCGGHALAEYENEIWMMPYDGQVVVRWNPETNETREYKGFPKNFLCRKLTDGSVCMEKPFCMPAFYGDYIYLPPCQANMSLKLNVDTGKFEQWMPVFELKKEQNEMNDLESRECFMFLDWKLRELESSFRIYSFSRGRLYDMNPNGTIFRETVIQIDMEEIEHDEPGFCKCSETLPYVCIESYFNTLTRFLGAKIMGNPFSHDRQLEVYKDIIVNLDGGCGKEVHEFVKKLEK